MDRGARKQNPQKITNRPVASAPTHATQNIASKPAREQERAARPTRRAGHAEREGTYPRKKKEFREAKRRSTEKINARASAWRNKRNKKQEMETIQRPIQEINQNGKTKPDLDYAGVTPLSSRD